MTQANAAAKRTEPADITAAVVASFEGCSDARVCELIQTLVKHLHAFATEVRLTEEEWASGIRILTETGDITDERRQEFILWSDSLGLSMLVDALSNTKPDGATESTVLGPFYVPGSPERAYGDSIMEQEGGVPAWIHGRVLDVDGSPIAGAELDVWQNAATGFYAVQQPDEQPATNLRGRYRADERGAFRIRTVRPVPYPIPDDGPVGRLLRDTGRHPWRAAHVHLIVRADGFEPVVSHVFDRDSAYLDSDTVFGVKDSLVRDFVRGDDGVLVCEHDVVLRSGPRT